MGTIFKFRSPPLLARVLCSEHKALTPTTAQALVDQKSGGILKKNEVGARTDGQAQRGAAPRPVASKRLCQQGCGPHARGGSRLANAVPVAAFPELGHGVVAVAVGRGVHGGLSGTTTSARQCGGRQRSELGSCPRARTRPATARRGGCSQHTTGHGTRPRRMGRPKRTKECKTNDTRVQQARGEQTPPEADRKTGSERQPPYPTRAHHSGQRGERVVRNKDAKSSD